LLELDVRVLSALGPEIADGCESRVESCFQVVGRARDAQRQALARDLLVPRRLAVRVQQDVRVALDQPGVSVKPGRSITVAPAAATAASGPTASMRSPFTRTLQPS
jgi:hypothetical protein